MKVFYLLFVGLFFNCNFALCQSFDEFLKLGKEKQEKYDYKGSIKEFESALLIDPKSSKAYFEIGWSKYFERDYHGAYSAYSSAIYFDPNYGLAFYYRGMISWEIFKNLTAAIADISKAVELSPHKTGNDYFTLAKLKYELIDFRGSISMINTAIELSKVSTEYYLHRGKCNFNLKDFKSAIADFEYVISRLPRNGEAFFYLGKTHILMGKRDQGCQELSRSGEIGFAEAYNEIKSSCQ